MPAMAMMRWKWATTKKVLWRYSSRIGWARIGPVRPPVMKSETKPREKSMAVEYCGFARQVVASQLRTLAEAGRAMAMVEMEKAELAKGLRPATNMWCPQRRMPRKPIRRVVVIMVRWGKTLRWLKFARSMEVRPRPGRMAM